MTRKLLIIVSVLLAICPSVFAEQCKHCDDLLAAGIILALIVGLALIFIFAVVVFFSLNIVTGKKPKNMGTTFVGAIFGGTFGVIVGFPYLLLVFGSVVGYYLSPKKQIE